jgi:hypothetical protein
MRDWQKLVSLLLEALGDEVAARKRPGWFFVAKDHDNADPEAFALGIGWDPDPLLGSLAPPDWIGVGVVATGKTFTPVPGTQEGYYVNGRRTGTVRMACLVTRDEGSYAKAVTSDGQVIEDAPGGGLLIDQLRGCIGLPALPIDLSRDWSWAG